MDSANETRRRAEVMASLKKDWASGEKSSGSDGMVFTTLEYKMCFYCPDFKIGMFFLVTYLNAIEVVGALHMPLHHYSCASVA